MLLKGVLRGKRIKITTAIAIVVALLLSPALSQPASASTDDYPAKWKNIPIDSTLDDWGMYNRQCTSFVAWRLSARNGFDMPFHADANKWSGIARGMGYRVDSVPAVGAVATSGNHVAWVESVDSATGTITVEEYNKVDSNGDGIYANDGTYTQRTVPANSFQYIHFKDINSGVVLAGTGNSYKEKMIRSPDGTISYVAANGLRYWIPHMGIVGCLGGTYTQLDQVTFNSVASSGDAANCFTRYNGKMIRDPTGSISYVDAKGMRHWVSTMSTVACLGGAYIQIDQSSYNSIPDAKNAADCDSRYLGRLIRAPDGTVSYVGSNTWQHYISSASVVTCLGGWSAVINMDWQTFDQFAVDSPANCSTK